MDEKFETFFFKNLRLPFQKWLGQRIFKLQNSKFFSWNKFFLDHKFGHKIGFHHTVLQTLFMNCSILLHSLERKIKKRNFEKISNCKKIIKTPPKTFSPLLLHNFSYILPTWLPDTPIDFPPWRNILKKFFARNLKEFSALKLHVIVRPVVMINS